MRGLGVEIASGCLDWVQIKCAYWDHIYGGTLCICNCRHPSSKNYSQLRASQGEMTYIVFVFSDLYEYN